MFKRNHRTSILMAAVGAMLSAGGSIVTAATAQAFPDDGRIRLVHTTTEQLCEFDNKDQAQGFHDALPEDERPHWRLIGVDLPQGADITGHRVIEVDLTQLRAGLAADAARENAGVVAALAAAPVATPIATETPAASPATGETPAAGE